MNGRTARKLACKSHVMYYFFVRVPAVMFPTPPPKKPDFGEPTGTEGCWREHLGDDLVRYTNIFKFYAYQNANEKRNLKDHPGASNFRCEERTLTPSLEPSLRCSFWESTYRVVSRKDLVVERGFPDPLKVQQYIQYREWFDYILVGNAYGGSGNSAIDKLHQVYGDETYRGVTFYDNGDAVIQYGVKPYALDEFASQLAGVFRYAKRLGHHLRLLKGPP